MKKIISTLLFSAALQVSAQDCQLVSLSLAIPAGVAKHHFPSQPMPEVVNKSDGNDFFTYSAAWNEGDLAVRIRFSNDGANWTAWSVLKRDYIQAQADASPLHLAASNYSHVEWSVYNKTGEASNLSLNFYYPSENPVHVDVLGSYAMSVSPIECPQPELINIPTQTRVVSTGNEK